MTLVSIGLLLRIYHEVTQPGSLTTQRRTPRKGTTR